MADQISFIFCMILEPYFQKFLHASGMGWKVKYLPNLSLFHHILSSAHATFFISCINDLSLKWFKLVYKVDNFDSF